MGRMKRDPLIFAKIFDNALEQLRPVLEARRIVRMPLSTPQAQDALRLIRKHNPEVKRGDLGPIKNGLIEICRRSPNMRRQDFSDLCEFTILECIAAFRDELSAPGDLSGTGDVDTRPNKITIVDGNLVSSVEAADYEKRMRISR
jgi:hypothetical protein